MQNGQEVFICPLGDIQYAGDVRGVASDHLIAHIERANKLGALYIGTGDYIDLASPSNRARMRSAGLYDTTQQIIRDKAAELVEGLYGNYLESTQGRWLGLVHGHHWFPVDEKQTTDQLLASMLRTQYLGTCAYVVLDFDDIGDSQRHGRVVLWVHHGKGHGKAAAPISVLENVAPYWEADIFVMGHQTKLAAAPINRVYPRQVNGVWQLEHKKVLLVGAGGWSKAYTQGHLQDGRPGGCYVEEAMLNPTSLGGPFIKVIPKWDSRRWYPEISVEV